MWQPPPRAQNTRMNVVLARSNGLSGCWCAVSVNVAAGRDPGLAVEALLLSVASGGDPASNGALLPLLGDAGFKDCEADLLANLMVGRRRPACKPCESCAEAGCENC